MRFSNSSKLKLSLIRRNRKKKTPLARESALAVLPSELKQRVASFLPVHELLNLAQTSRSMKSDIDISVLSSPLTDRLSKNKNYQSAGTTACFAVVIPNQETESHSMTFCFDIISGITTTYGEMWIVEQDLPVDQKSDILRERRFGSGKVIATTASTPAKSKFAMPVYPRAGKFYQFWINTGEEEFMHFTNLRVENMTLYRASIASKSMEHTAFQFDVQLQAPVRRRVNALR